MKKKLVAVVAICALAMSAVLIAGCSGGNDSKASSSDTKSDKYTLVVGFDAGYPPYGFIDKNGNYAGFDLDLAQLVCEENGWDLKTEPIDWDAKDALLNGGTINCIWNGFTYEGRENDYTWTDPYMLNEQVIVAKADGGPANAADLAGKTVMTQVDSAAYEVLNDPEGSKPLADTFKSLQTIGDYNNAFMQLESGVVDAVACDLSIAKYQMAAKPNAYKIIDTLSSEHYAVGLKKGDTDTAAKITAALKKLDESGKVKELCEKYADYGMDYSNWVLGK